MDRRVRRTRTLIKNAFIELLKEKDLSALTITELTHKADIDRRTFYLHYSCIEDIVVDIEKEAMDALHQLLLSMTDFNISSFFDGLSNIITENIDFFRIVTENDNYHRFIAKCKSLLKSVIKDQFFSSSTLSEEDFDIYCEYVSSGIVGIYCNWLISDSAMTLEELTHKAEIAVLDSWNLIINSSK